MVPRKSYRTPAGRTSYKTLAADLDKQHQAALKELERIPMWLRVICAKLRGK